MNSKNEKILVCIDGSEYSMNAVHYIGDLLVGQKVQFVLFHTMWKINEAFFDMGMHSVPRKRIVNIEAWEFEHEKNVRNFMNKARKILLDTGFPAEFVKIHIQKKKIGIARDIIIEAKNGYSAVIVGRKGTSKIKDLILGSIAIKLIEKLCQIPVCVVGEKPDPNKILVALDSSECSMRTVDYLKKILKSLNLKVTILHVVRNLDAFQIAANGIIFQENDGLIKEAKADIQPVLDEAKRRLLTAGLNPASINSKIITNHHSRANAILEEAKKGHYGTIVVGRRGVSKIEDFLMGRVSNKLIHIAKEMAVWIVS